MKKIKLMDWGGLTGGFSVQMKQCFLLTLVHLFTDRLDEQ